MANSNRKRPLYDQLVDLLKGKIENEFEPDTLLPSERELVAQYGVSRTTVRQALQELEQMNYIYRRHGKGTFVSDLRNHTTNLSGAYSFTDQMRSLGRIPETKILLYRVVEATKYFADKLNVNLGDKLIKIKRLRLADGIPMMLERTYLPFKLFLSLTEEHLAEKPLYEIFSEEYGQVVKMAEEEFYAGIARINDSDFLDINEGMPVLNLIRTTYNAKNEIIEYTLSVARGDQFKYKTVHIRA
jgi:GntR family transcriptional regulator